MKTKKTSTSAAKQVTTADNTTRTVNVDLPRWAIAELDREADRRAVARQALIKHWLVERLDELRERRAG